MQGHCKHFIIIFIVSSHYFVLLKWCGVAILHRRNAAAVCLFVMGHWMNISAMTCVAQMSLSAIYKALSDTRGCCLLSVSAADAIISQLSAARAVFVEVTDHL